MRVAAVLVVVAQFACAQPQAGSLDSYRAIHDALMDSFLPVVALQNDLTLSHRLSLVREEIWVSAGQSPQFREMIGSFTNLGAFPAICKLDAVLRTASGKS